MATFVLRLKAHRPAFAQTITEEELQVMGRHAAHWQAWLDRGDLVVFGPVLTDEDSYGLAVVETDDEAALREHAAADPAVTERDGRVRGRAHAGRARARVRAALNSGAPNRRTQTGRMLYCVRRSAERMIVGGAGSLGDTSPLIGPGEAADIGASRRPDHSEPALSGTYPCPSRLGQPGSEAARSNVGGFCFAVAV